MRHCCINKISSYLRRNIWQKMKRRTAIKLGGLALASLAFPLPAKAKYDRMTKTTDFEVIIVGGSYSGLSAAMALGRSLRSVLIIDGGSPCNKQTPHSHNFITQDGETPAAIALKARQQVLAYNTIKLLEDVATTAKKTNMGFEVTTLSGKKFICKKLIVATGVKDTMPAIKGFAECWGISVVHCPYCHGYELRGKRTAIYANGDKAFHLASLVNNLTGDITILTSGKADMKDEQIKKLRNRNISIVETEVAAIEHDNGRLNNIVFSDGSKMQFDGMYGAIPFTQHCTIPIDLACEMTEHGLIKVDMFQKTSVDGVFACGDNSSMMRSLANAVYTGNVAGVMVNMELTNENF
jgi:thioredoxin reductase